MNLPPLKSSLKFYAAAPAADWVERMVKAGADMMQLRRKALHGNELKHKIERCAAACQSSATRLFISDHWHEAIETGVHGVHLGQEDMDTADLAAIEAVGLRLGLSTHSVAEPDRALSIHPSYVASGVIFPTTTRQMPIAPQGSDKLCEYVRQAHDTPIVAIGGIDLNSAEDALATGVSSLVVIHVVTEVENSEAAIETSQALWDQ